MSGREKYVDSVVDSIMDYELDELKKAVNGEISDEELYDNFFNSDSITGNLSGSFYCNAYKAEEALCHCMDLIQEMVKEQYIDMERLLNPEYVDVCCRCYVLGEAIETAKRIYQQKNN